MSRYSMCSVRYGSIAVAGMMNPVCGFLDTHGSHLTSMLPRQTASSFDLICSFPQSDAMANGNKMLAGEYIIPEQDCVNPNKRPVVLIGKSEGEGEQIKHARGYVEYF